MWVVKFSCCLTMCFSLLSHRDDHIWLQASEDLTDKALAPQLSKCHAGCVLSVVFTLRRHHQVQPWFICHRETSNIHHTFVFFWKIGLFLKVSSSVVLFLCHFLSSRLCYTRSLTPPPPVPYNCACHSVHVWHYMIVCVRLLQACFHLPAWRSVSKITPAIFTGDLSAAAWRGEARTHA